MSKVLTSFKSLIISTAALAELWGVTDRTVRNYCDDGLPKISNGKFNFLEAFAWWNENINKPASDKEEKAREKYWAAKAEREELVVADLKGQVIKKSELYPMWTFRVQEIVKGLESQERIFPTLLEMKPGAEIAKIVADYNYKLRENYARDGKYTPVADYAKNDKQVEAKAASKSKPAKESRQQKNK